MLLVYWVSIDKNRKIMIAACKEGDIDTLRLAVSRLTMKQMSYYEYEEVSIIFFKSSPFLFS